MAFPSTFADIQDSVIVKARLDETLDLAKVKDWINQAYAEVCVETEANVSADTMTLTANVASYTLAVGIARIKQMILTPVGSTASGPPLILTTLDEILELRQGGGNIQQASHVSHYTLVGLNQFEVWPTPAGADVITIWIVELPTPLSADADVPILQEPYSSALLEYGALCEAGDFKGDPQTEFWEQQFNSWKARYVEHLKKRRGVIPGQFHQWGDGWDSQWSDVG